MKNVVQNVLLLEDESIIAIDIEDTLRELGASSIFTADTCAAAIDWLKHHKPTVAIIDPRLKDGYCAPVARHLVEMDIPFIVYSGDPGKAAEEERAFERGVWLSKPSTPEVLQTAILSLSTAAAH